MGVAHEWIRDGRFSSHEGRSEGPQALKLTPMLIKGEFWEARNSDLFNGTASAFVEESPHRRHRVG